MAQKPGNETAQPPRSRSVVRQSKRKRRLHWWQCSPPAFCDECKTPMLVTSSHRTEETLVQYRECPGCGSRRKTHVLDD